MKHLTQRLRPLLTAVLICLLVGLQTEAHADPHAAAMHPHASTPVADPSPSNFNLNFHFGRDIAIAAVVIGAVAGVGLYFLLRKGPGITGCVAAHPDGLQIVDEGDQRTYALTGKTVLLKPDERVRVYGKKEKANGAARLFVVKKRPTLMGACSAGH